MSGFERTKQAADIFAKLICCANPHCSQESDQLQTLGTACKHAFCWDCINYFSNMDTLVVCPVCSCPLEVHRPKAAQMFNNLAQHINEFKLLLQEYGRVLRSEGTAVAGTIEQTQKLLEAHGDYTIQERGDAARNAAINEFISTQRISLAGRYDDDVEGQSESDFSEELHDTPPPQLTRETEPENVVKHDPPVKFGECVDNFFDEEVTATAKTSGLVTDSLPQFVQPVMTSTQQPHLFLSQAVHARNDMFEKEDKQEIRTYRSEKLCNYFVTKPKNTFHTRKHKVNEAPWLNLSDMRHTTVTEELIEVKCENNISGTPLCRTSCETPRREPKVEWSSNSRSRKSSFSFPKTEQCSSDPVIAAVIGGKLDDVQDAIEAGYDVNQRDYKKRTPLFIAVEMERLDICQCLIERGGAVINANCGSDCNTALHVAVSQGNEEIVKYLLSKGASKTIRNIRQQTPSQLAQPHSPLRLLVEKYRSHPKQPFVARLPDVYVVCISREIRKALSYHDLSIINKLMTVIDFCDETTTHYVVSVDANGASSSNADLLRAMMQNTRVMSTEWLNECIRQEKILPHTNYEVSKLRHTANDVVYDSLSRCRKSKERMEPGLFHGCKFFFLAKKYKGIDDRHLLRDLIRLGGGELSAKEPKFVPNAPGPFHAPHLSSPLFIIYDVTVTANIPSVFHRYPKRYNLVTAQWVIECVVEYTIKSIS